MNIRIISGEFGGRVLDAPRGRTTHPMGERIRNALFNSIQAEIPGADVLDVFAGTGALGLEAVSRGANSALLVEKNRLAQKIIAKNIDLLGLEDERAKLYRTTASSWYSTHKDMQFDIIFVDPPYYDINRHLSTVEKILGLLKPGALMVLSRPGKCEELVANNEVVVVDNRSYGDATLTFYRRKA
jgi:16S rRNA (guanine966-N2)-methyltransferase